MVQDHDPDFAPFYGQEIDDKSIGLEELSEVVEVKPDVPTADALWTLFRMPPPPPKSDGPPRPGSESGGPALA
jgi:hypothetical protein